MKREEIKALIERFGGQKVTTRSIGVERTGKEVRAIITTELPADVFDWERFDIVREVMLMDGMVLPMNRSQVPLLDTHSRWSIKDQLGSVSDFSDVTIAGYRGKIGVPSFSSVPDAQEAKTKVEEGHVTDLSAGYEVLESTWIPPRTKQTVKDQEYDGGETGLKVTTQWKLKEVSLCPIGADELATIRSEAQRTPPNMDDVIAAKVKEQVESALRTEVKPQHITTPRGGAMTPEELAAKAATEQAERAANEELAKQAEAKRVKNIEAVRDSYKDRFDAQRGSGALATMATDAITLKIPDIVFQAEVFNEISNDGKPLQTQRDYLDMSSKQRQGFSVLKGIRDLINGGLTGLEKEAHEEIYKKISKQNLIGMPGSGRSFCIPRDIREMPIDRAAAARVAAAYNQRALNATSFGSGGAVVLQDLRMQDMIEMLRNQPVVARAGARVWSGLSGNVGLPKHSTGVNIGWKSETGSSDSSDAGFGLLMLTPHRLTGTTGWTLELVMQTSLDVEAFAREDMMQALAVARDLAAINGSGNTGQPLGIINTTGINSVTFGGAITFGKLVDAETSVLAANVLGTVFAYITTTTTRGKAKQTLEASAAGARWIWQDDRVNGYPGFHTQQVPSNKVIFGHMPDLILADWDGIVVTLDELTRKKEGIIEVTMHMWADNGVRRAVSFTVSTDSGAQ